MMRVNDLFHSIQGEGLWTGMPMTFVRLQGCNLACPWCDTQEAIPTGDGEEVPAMEVFDLISDFPPRVVCVTGGEPTLQMKALEDLCELLHKYQYRIHLETNGTIKLSDYQLACFDWITVSPKPPLFNCVLNLNRVNEMKFVVGSAKQHKNYASRSVIKRYMERLPVDVPIWVQPDNNRPDAFRHASDLVESLWAPPLRLGISIQLHKILKLA